MNLFHLVEKEGKNRQEPLSPPRSKKKEIKRNKTLTDSDLCDTSDLSSDTDDVSREEELSVEAKLERAKNRREKASKQLELVLNEKNEQAFQRAQKSIASKREKIRNKNRKVKKVNERHSYLEMRRRYRTMHSIENRLNSALTRAEENLKKRQGRARRTKRIERAQNKRSLIEFERRSALLASVGHRFERATRNLQLRLEDLQGKARDEIQHAHDVSKRVKAVRVLQKSIRVNFGFKDQSDQSHLSMTTAALRFQNFVSWKVKVTATRLSTSDDLECLKKLLFAMGLSNSGESVLGASFEQLTAAITNPTSLACIKKFLGSFGPLLHNSATPTKPCPISTRTLLSVFLVAMQPDEILGGKRGNDKCSNLLEKAAGKLVSVLIDLSKLKSSQISYSEHHDIIKEVGSKIVSYCTLFDKWKNADFDELVEKMTKSALQSWVVFLISKQALLYIEEKSSPGNGEFQLLLKHKSSRRGAGLHIKRVRAAMKKILGDDQSFTVMRGAKQAALKQIEEQQSMVPIKAEIDNVLDSFANDSSRDDDDNNLSDDSPSIENATIPDSILSNSQLVHQLLLMDNEELEELSKNNSENFSHLDTAQDFMLHYKNHNVATEWVEGTASMGGIKQVMIDLINKMRKLVPNREDLQQYFTESQVQSCETVNDYFTLTLKMAHVMMNSLESQHRAVATLEWCNVTSSWSSQNYESSSTPYDFTCWRSFLIASLAFFIGKAELCQIEVVNFQLLQIAPIVRANGRDYEIQHFQEKFGELSSINSMDSFSATRNWIERIKKNSSKENLKTQLQQGFVDDILFTKDVIDIPEVLNLDLHQIRNIREKARLAVISASLFLHSCKVTNTRISDLNCDSLSSETKYYKDKIGVLLDSRLPYDAMLKGVSDALSMFAQKISGQPLDQIKIETLTNVTNSVLKGNDPVFALIDQRMRSVFRCACSFTCTDEGIKSQPPVAMKTGLLVDSKPNEKIVNGLKVQFMTSVGKEARKLGFNIVEDIIVQTAYEAYKVISHCIALYEEVLFTPIVHQLNTTKESS